MSRPLDSIRQSQVITTYGPGALIDLPTHSAIVGGLDTWSANLQEILESRPLHGAACHGCSLIAETSCEMRNDFLDRALVVPVLGLEDAAFFSLPE